MRLLFVNQYLQIKRRCERCEQIYCVYNDNNSYLKYRFVQLENKTLNWKSRSNNQAEGENPSFMPTFRNLK
jgi:hypothetical protein